MAGIALLYLGWIQWRLVEVSSQVSILEERLMQTLVARWTDADGVEHTVNTPPLDGETPEAHVERHVKIVKLMKDAFPPAR